MLRQLEYGDAERFHEMIDKNTEVYSDYYGSEICFDVLWQWRKAQAMRVWEDKKALIVCGFDPELPQGERDQVSFLFPFCESRERFVESVREIVRHAGKRTLVTCLSERMRDILAPEIPGAVFDRWPEMDEYLYRTEDLITFAGKKYHAKRNFVRQFEHSYSYVIRPCEGACSGEVSEVLKIWAAEKGELLEDENEAIRIALAHRERLKIDLLFIEGEIESFVIGERVRDFAVIMYFKCNTAFKGIYPFMLSQFVRRNFSDCAYVSMQEDMGIEGLRRSKESYHPAFLQQKYKMRIE